MKKLKKTDEKSVKNLKIEKRIGKLMKKLKIKRLKIKKLKRSGLKNQ
ncbi:hypothetical protein HPNQ4044_0447 [Helicobacter pylori NQ4044]|uniref:Uncharacterized protein n=1 Tax=Helicobacter pylori NQ4044 TaxID=992028 RepID=J0JIM2_HELPX|nr:hypothetical protein HPNQ4044_0447 [Helicobacter pylori NQ4044]